MNVVGVIIMGEKQINERDADIVNRREAGIATGCISGG